MYSNMKYYENICNCLRVIQQDINRKLKSANCWQRTSLNVLPVSSLTCKGVECTCTGGHQLTARSEGWRTVFMSTLQMTQREACSDIKLFPACSPHLVRYCHSGVSPVYYSDSVAGIEPGTSSTRGQCANHLAYHFRVRLAFAKGFFFFFFQYMDRDLLRT